MIEKALHAGNVSACIGAVVTAADISLFGGSTLAISAALSTVAVYKELNRTEKTLAQEMAKGFEAHVARAHLSPDRKKIVVQMLERFSPNYPDLARGNMVAETIAAQMRARVERTATDSAYQTACALDDYMAALCAILPPLLKPLTAMEAMQQELLRRTHVSGEAQNLYDAGISNNAIITLAQRIARNTEDLGQAWIELQNALEIAIQLQRKGHITSNHGDFVDEVLARVAKLAAQGDYARASDAIAQALAEEEAAHQARASRLLQSGIELAMLQGDATTAATLLAKQVDLESGGLADFEALHALQISYYRKGHDRGVAIDLEIAIELARLIHARATTANERGGALDDLGISLATLGERERGTARLEEAVSACLAALDEWTRDRVPLLWAMAQMNLGSTLAALGTRESGTARLEEAVSAYYAALEELTRHRAPPQWASAQMNLGNALLHLGTRESGTARLEEAVSAYRAALEEKTRDRVPLQWASAQMNLGNALRALGARESGTARLTKAVSACHAALEEWARDRVPMQWASAQVSLGDALATLGERESGTARLEEAISAYYAALEEMTRDRVPLQWAGAQMNLGNALATLGSRESGTTRLTEAASAYRAALEEMTRDRIPLQWALAQINLALLDLIFFDKTYEAAHLDRAEDRAHAAKEIFKAGAASQPIGEVERILAGILARRRGITL